MVSHERKPVHSVENHYQGKISEGSALRGRENRRSLHSATPDFLSKSVALAKFMRLSLRKAAHVVVGGFAKQEIRVRSGRDDKS
jgi:hypothetical protein